MENITTAVYWLKDELFKLHNDYDEGRIMIGEFAVKQRELFSIALEKEEKQIIEVAKGFWYYGNGSDAPPCYDSDIQKYIKKTYGKK